MHYCYRLIALFAISPIFSFCQPDVEIADRGAAQQPTAEEEPTHTGQPTQSEEANAEPQNGNETFEPSDGIVTGGDEDEMEQQRPTEPTQPLPTGGDELTRKHFQIQGSNYGALSQASKQMPLFLYGFATDPMLQGAGGDISRFIRDIDYPVMAKMMIFSSYRTVDKHLSNSATDQLFKSKDIKWLGYNLEGDKSPQDEFQNQVPAVIEFAKVSKRHGYRFIWGPIRRTIDLLSDQEIRSMCDAGLDGMALQEQNGVQGDCSNRIQPVKTTINRLRSLCGGDFYITVQILWGQRGNPDSTLCTALVNGIGDNVNSIALWANRSHASMIDTVFSNNQSFLSK